MSPNNEIKNRSINVSPSNSSATFSMNSKDELFNEPLQPVWPENVFIFKPTDSAESIKAQIKPTEDPSETFDLNGSTISYHNSKHHFDTKHYALLFTPGTYEDCAFEVGYYVGIAGLGKNAKDVVFKGKSGPYVEALNKDIPVTDGGSIAHDGSGLCLDTFWRSAENFTTEHMKWAVSQAAPLRRVHILNTLQFGDGEAYSSGGFLANAKIENTCNFIANQQWFSRGVEFQGDVQGMNQWKFIDIFSIQALQYLHLCPILFYRRCVVSGFLWMPREGHPCSKFMGRHTLRWSYHYN